VIDINSFKNLRLLGGFTIVEIEFTPEPFVDALGRDAIAQTRIIGKEFHILIRSDLSEKELSVTLYHEILEAASVGSWNPPASVMDFNEGDFESAGYAAHERWGNASEDNLNRLLQFYEFSEK
jgi:hypothetical protein